MLKFAIPLAVATACSPLKLEAQEAIVLSGEHPGFTRLFAYTGDEKGWKIVRKGRKAVIQSEEWENGFDTSQVFLKINRDRIYRFEKLDDRLEIFLNCDCQIKIAQFGKIGIVIDIQDEVLSTGSEVTPRFSPTSRSNLLESSTELSVALIEEELPSTKIEADVQRNTRTALDIQISRAGNAMENLQESSRLRISNPLDLLETVGPDQKEKSLPSECPKEAYGAIETWSTEDPLYVQLAAIRTNFKLEQDSRDAKLALTLARLFASFAMDQEARSVISTFSLGGPETEHLFEILALLSEDEFEFKLYDVQDSDCQASSRIWQILANNETLEMSQDDVSGLFFTLAEWPKPAREIAIRRIYNKVSAVIPYTAPTTALVRSLTSEKPFHESTKENISNEGLVNLPHLVRDPQFDLIASKSLELWEESRKSMSTEEIEAIESIIFQLQGRPIVDKFEKALLLNMTILGNYREAFERAQSSGEEMLSDIVSFATSEPVLTEDSARRVLLSRAIDEASIRNTLTEEQKGIVGPPNLEPLAGQKLTNFGDGGREKETLPSAEGTVAPEGEDTDEFTELLQGSESLRRELEALFDSQ